MWSPGLHHVAHNSTANILMLGTSLCPITSVLLNPHFETQSNIMFAAKLVFMMGHMVNCVCHSFKGLRRLYVCGMSEYCEVCGCFVLRCRRHGTLPVFYRGFGLRPVLMVSFWFFIRLPYVTGLEYDVAASLWFWFWIYFPNYFATSLFAWDQSVYELLVLGCRRGPL